jgi:hypothetical protein
MRLREFRLSSLASIRSTEMELPPLYFPFLLLYLGCAQQEPRTLEQTMEAEPVQPAPLTTTAATEPAPELAHHPLEPTLLYREWAHEPTDSRPAFSIDPDSFHIYMDPQSTYGLAYRLSQDTLEVFEYHEGRTTKGTIVTLNEHEFVVAWVTGDRNAYVPFTKGEE